MQPVLEVVDLGRMSYARAYELQCEVHDEVCRGSLRGAWLFVEHDPVITVSRRPGVMSHVLASEQRLRELGIGLESTDRGGDVTYHGPGQLVAYPVLRLDDFGLGVGDYMRLLEGVAINALASLGVRAARRAGLTGVWVEREGSSLKLAALGVRLKRGVSLHGLAINVRPDLSHFDTIVPCGLHGERVISLAGLLGEACPSLERVRDAVLREAGQALGCTFVKGRSRA
jgi:lipoate-protein ligase B